MVARRVASSPDCSASLPSRAARSFSATDLVDSSSVASPDFSFAAASVSLSMVARRVASSPALPARADLSVLFSVTPEANFDLVSSSSHRSEASSALRMPILAASSALALRSPSLEERASVSDFTCESRRLMVSSLLTTAAEISSRAFCSRDSVSVRTDLRAESSAARRAASSAFPERPVEAFFISPRSCASSFSCPAPTSPALTRASRRVFNSSAAVEAAEVVSVFSSLSREARSRRRDSSSFSREVRASLSSSSWLSSSARRSFVPSAGGVAFVSPLASIAEARLRGPVILSTAMAVVFDSSLRAKAGRSFSETIFGIVSVCSCTATLRMPNLMKSPVLIFSLPSIRRPLRKVPLLEPRSVKT